MQPSLITAEGKPYEGLVPPEEGDDFQIRGLAGQFAIAIKSGVGEALGKEVYSTQKYSFTLRNPIILNRISDQQWNSAALLPKSEKGVVPCISGCESYFHPVQYKGKEFRASGEHPTSGGDEAAFLSPNQNWLALQSYDGSIDRVTAHLPESGMLYVDVFDAHSGSKQFTAEIHRNSGGVEGPAGRTRWIGDDYLFLDISHDKQKLIFCDATKQTH
jgi:hypothetical protein